MEKKTYALMKKLKKGYKDTGSRFTGRAPSQAAKKAARQGHKTIYLRQTGKDTIRVYKGSIKRKKLTSDTPFKRKGQTVKIGQAKYLRTIKIK